MDPTDFHLIRPVTGLRKPANVAATGRHDERRRQSAQHDADEEPEVHGGTDDNVTADAPALPANGEDDPRTIDFCA